MQLSVIIVNYNVKYFLEQCLCSVMLACKNLDAEVFVVDNNSSDGSREYLENRFANVKFIWCAENKGFAKANNDALTAACGDYVLFLNPDTLLPADCLESCLSFFNGKVDAGALGVRMVNGTGSYLRESKRGFPAPFAALTKLTGLSAVFPRSKIFARYYLGHLDERSSHEVDVLSGAFMLVKKSVLDITGGFDERFFMYGEDIDLSYRLQQSGHSNWYFAGTTILHFKGESSALQSREHTRLFYGAMKLFAKKYYAKGSSRLQLLLLQTGISVGALLSRVAKPFSRLKRPMPPGGKVLVVADAGCMEEIRAILLATDPACKIIQFDQVVATNGDQHLVAMLNNQLQAGNVSNLVIGINGFTAKQAIGLLKSVQAATFVGFHFSGTASIVGSGIGQGLVNISSG